MAEASTIDRKALVWRWRHFALFSGPEWHRLISLRTAIFVVEQACPYLEADEKDPECWHLELLLGERLIGTLRVLPPGVNYPECSIGRVSVDADYRQCGLGRDLMLRALDFCNARWPEAVRLSAQSYLSTFYESMGFVMTRGPYFEDNIEHVEMLKEN